MNPVRSSNPHSLTAAPMPLARQSMSAFAMAIAFGFLGLAVCLPAQAGTLSSWRGTTNANWGTTSNWSTAVDTSGTFALVFGGTTQTTTTNNLGTVNIDSLLFTNNGTVSRTGTFTLGGSTIRLVNASVTTTAMSSGTITDIISAPVSVSGTASFNSGGNHNLTLSSTVSGGMIYKTGAGQLTLSGSFASDLNVVQGLVNVNSLSSRGLNGRVVGIGNTTAFAGQLLFANVTGSNSMQIRMDDNAVISTSQGSNVVFTAPTFNVATTSTNVTLFLNGGAGANIGTMTINGVIQDNTSSTVSVGIANGNTWVLKGANTYTGTTGVSSTAKLLLDGNIGSGAATIAGYLGGSGTFGGAVSIIGSGTLSPGGFSTTGATVTDSIGRLTMDSLNLASGARSLFTVSGTSAGVDFDQIVGSSSVAYGGTLALTLSGTQAYAKDTIFNLFKDFATRSGSFSSVTLAAAGTPYADLTFTNLGGGIWETGSTAAPLGEYLRFEESTGDLVVVPEPSTFVLAGLGAVLVGAQVWRRRRAAV